MNLLPPAHTSIPSPPGLNGAVVLDRPIQGCRSAETVLVGSIKRFARSARHSEPITYRGLHLQTVACGPGRIWFVRSTTHAEPGEGTLAEVPFVVRHADGGPVRRRFCIAVPFVGGSNRHEITLA